MNSMIPYLGCKVSLISKSEIRYEGILYTVDSKESTLALVKVRSFETENRLSQQIRPNEEGYGYIIFRARDITDLSVCEDQKPETFGLDSDPFSAKQSAQSTQSVNELACSTFHSNVYSRTIHDHTMSASHSLFPSSSMASIEKYYTQEDHISATDENASNPLGPPAFDAIGLEDGYHAPDSDRPQLQIIEAGRGSASGRSRGVRLNRRAETSSTFKIKRNQLKHLKQRHRRLLNQYVPTSQYETFNHLFDDCINYK